MDASHQLRPRVPAQSVSVRTRRRNPSRGGLTGLARGSSDRRVRLSDVTRGQAAPSGEFDIRHHCLIS
jgi:hypothetical protein